MNLYQIVHEFTLSWATLGWSLLVVFMLTVVSALSRILLGFSLLLNYFLFWTNYGNRRLGHIWGPGGYQEAFRLDLWWVQAGYWLVAVYVLWPWINRVLRIPNPFSIHSRYR